MHQYAIIGFGRWGKKVFFNKILNKRFSIIFTRSKNRNIPKNIKRVYTTNSIADIKKYLHFFDSAHICTPCESHFRIAKFLIENKKNVIIEKPITNSLSKINILEKLANNHNVKVIVNYNDIYDPGILLLKNLRNKNSIKKIKISYSSQKKYLSKYDFIYDWLDHVLIIINFFKMLNYDLNFKEYKFSNKNKKMSFFLLFECKLKNFEIEVAIGNSKKIRRVKLFFFNGKQAIYSNHKSPGIFNYFNPKKKIIMSKKIYRDNLKSLYNFFENISLKKKVNFEVEKKIFTFKKNILKKIFI
jgi:hypothetical protein